MVQSDIVVQLTPPADEYPNLQRAGTACRFESCHPDFNTKVVSHSQMIDYLFYYPNLHLNHKILKQYMRLKATLPRVRKICPNRILEKQQDILHFSAITLDFPFTFHCNP